MLRIAPIGIDHNTLFTLTPLHEMEINNWANAP